MVKNVGEPCAGEPHARIEVAAGGNQASRASTCRAAQAPPADPTKSLSSASASSATACGARPRLVSETRYARPSSGSRSRATSPASSQR
jgi:hypothetical protein